MDITSLFKWISDNLSNPYFAAFIAGLITLVFMYLDAKITRKFVHRRTYTKNILLVSIITGTVVYILTNTALHPKITKMSETAKKGMVGGMAEKLSYDTADILLGEPNF
jgi:uncharacterized membrane protein YsdA (DUF1294 family)